MKVIDRQRKESQSSTFIFLDIEIADFDLLTGFARLLSSLISARRSVDNRTLPPAPMSGISASLRQATVNALAILVQTNLVTVKSSWNSPVPAI
jgi:hypothetical protein